MKKALNNFFKQVLQVGGSPGLVAMRGPSCSKGRGFESRHSILDGHFSHLFVVKLQWCLFERPKINNKRGRSRSFFYKKTYPAATVNVVGPKSHVMLKRRVEWVMIRRLSCTVSDADILGSKEPKHFAVTKLRLPSCCPGFESQARHLCSYHL